MSAPLKDYAARVITWVDLTPVCDTAAYAQNDVLFISTKIPNAAWKIDVPVQLMGLMYTDEDNNTAYDALFFFFDSATASMGGAANAAASISDADSRNITGRVTMTGANSLATGFTGAKQQLITPTNVFLKPASGTRDVYVGCMITSASTPTHTASGVKLRFAFAG